MRITKRQLRRIIKKEKKALVNEAYNSMSPRSKSLANAAKRQFAKDYPDVQVGIDGREGWLTVNGKKAVNMSQASGSPLSMDDIIDQMKQAYLGHPVSSQEVPESEYSPEEEDKIRKSVLGSMAKNPPHTPWEGKSAMRESKKRIHESEADDEGLRGWQDFFAGEAPSPTASDWYLDGYEDAEKAHRDNPEKYSIAMRESLSIQKITKRQLRRIIKEEKQRLLSENRGAEMALGSFANVSTTDQLTDSILNVLQEVEVGAVEDGHGDEDAGEMARSAALLAVAQAFQSAGLTDVYMALYKLIR